MGQQRLSFNHTEHENSSSRWIVLYTVCWVYNWKNSICFCRRTQGDANFEVGLQKYAINAAFLYRENETVGLYIAFVLKQIVKIL